MDMRSRNGLNNIAHIKQLNMEYFLREVFDIQDVSVVVNNKELIDEQGLLHYNFVYNNQRIKDGLCFVWVWRQFFNVYPSKIDICKFLEVSKQDVSFHNIVEYLLNHSFVGFVIPEYEKQIPSWTGPFILYKKSLDDHSIVKREIGLKLCDRFQADEDILASPNRTLFTIYKTMIGVDIHQWYKSQHDEMKKMGLDVRNPLIHTRHKTPMLMFPALNVYECLAHVIANDYYLLRMLFTAEYCMYTDSHVCTLDDKHKPVIISTKLDPETINKTMNAFVVILPFQNVINIIPAICKKFIYIGELKKPVTLARGSSSSTIQIDANPVCKNGWVMVHENDNKNVLGVSDPHSTTIVLPSDPDHFLFMNPSLISLYLDTNQTNKVYVINELVKYVLRHKLDPKELNHIVRKEQAKNAVVIIDNRDNIMSVLSVMITCHNLNPNSQWTLVVMSSSRSIEYYKKHFNNDNRIEYISLPIFDKKYFDIDDYNIIMKHPDTWQYLYHYERVLTIQDDGMIVKPGVEKFLGFDYVGAPWPLDIPVNKVVADVNPDLVGNGGLSLRNPKLMRDICIEDKKENKSLELFNHDIQPIPEDVYFSIETYQRGASIPNRTLASSFSTEMLMNTNAIGFHKVWGYHQLSDIHKFFKTVS